MATDAKEWLTFFLIYIVHNIRSLYSRFMLETSLMSTCLRSASSSMLLEMELSKMGHLFMQFSSWSTNSLGGDNDENNQMWFGSHRNSKDCLFELESESD